MTEHHIALEMDTTGKGQLQNGIQTVSDAVDSKNVRVRRAVPEIDDDDENDERPSSTDGRGGIDDGLLNRQPAANEPRQRRPSYHFPGYEGPGMVEFNGVMTPIPDVNAYQQKKTLAQGMMDLALLSANANQLRYVLETYQRHPYYWPSLIFITLSICFQVAVGVGLILNGQYNIKNEQEICRANRINNYTVIGIFVITVVNVLISAFGVAEPGPST